MLHENGIAASFGVGRVQQKIQHGLPQGQVGVARQVEDSTALAENRISVRSMERVKVTVLRSGEQRQVARLDRRRLAR